MRSNTEDTTCTNIAARSAPGSFASWIFAPRNDWQTLKPSASAVRGHPDVDAEPGHRRVLASGTPAHTRAQFGAPDDAEGILPGLLDRRAQGGQEHLDVAFFLVPVEHQAVDCAHRVAVRHRVQGLALVGGEEAAQEAVGQVDPGRGQGAQEVLHHVAGHPVQAGLRVVLTDRTWCLWS